MRINGFNQIKSNYLKNKSKVSTGVQKQDKNETAAQKNDKVEISHQQCRQEILHWKQASLTCESMT